MMSFEATKGFESGMQVELTRDGVTYQGRLGMLGTCDGRDREQAQWIADVFCTLENGEFIRRTCWFGKDEIKQVAR